MCSDNKLVIIDVEQLPAATKTFTSKGSGSSSWIDHCLLSDTIAGQVRVPYDITPSDHIPVTIELKLHPTGSNKEPVKQCKPKIKWRKFTTAQKQLYEEKVNRELDKTDWSICGLHGFDNVEHYKRIERNTVRLIDALKLCGNLLIKHVTNHRGKREGEHGWNDLIKPSYDNYRAAFLNWCASEKKDESLFRTMNERRKVFKCSLRK